MARRTSHKPAARLRTSGNADRWFLAAKLMVLVLASTAIVVFGSRFGKQLFVDHVARRVQVSEDRIAARWVGELSRFDQEAFPAFVEAANSPRSTVALTARREIDRRVAKWQREVFLQPATFPLRTKALPLALAFEGEAANLSLSGRRWARGTLEQLLSMAEQQPQGDRLKLIEACDEALAKLPASPPNGGIAKGIAMNMVIDPPSSGPPTAPRDHQRPDPATHAPPPIQPTSPAPKPAFTATILPQTARTESESEPAWNPNWGRPAQSPLAQSPLAQSPLAQSPLASVEPEKNPNVVPRENGVSLLPPPPAPLVESTPLGESSDKPPAEIDPGDARPMVSDDDVPWFAQLATGTTDQQQLAAKKLAELGYGLVTPRDARMLNSASLRDRLALVDLSLTSPRLESSKWLWRLAHDASGEVRAAAIASIATSNDPKLMQQALELAIRDTDPRVAEQSTELRKRLR